MFERILPIETDDDVLRLAREVIEADGGHRGDERLTWVLLLDASARPLPVVIPIRDMPVDADPEDVQRFADALGGFFDGTEAEQAVVLWQRPGGGAIRMHEADWAAGLAAAAVPLRAQLLVTDDGIRLLDPAFEAIVAV